MESAKFKRLGKELTKIVPAGLSTTFKRTLCINQFSFEFYGSSPDDISASRSKGFLAHGRFGSFGQSVCQSGDLVETISPCLVSWALSFGMLADGGSFPLASSTRLPETVAKG